MCGGALRTLFTAAPTAAAEGYHPPLLVDENGRLYVRLADKLASATDSVTVERGASCGVGAHGNAWLNVAAAINAFSVAIDTGSCSQISIFGNVNAATSLNVQLSQDGANWYTLESVNIAAAGNFGFNRTIGARYIRLQTTSAATITATISAKA